MSSIHDSRYKRLIEELRRFREENGITQLQLAEILFEPQSYVAKVEGLERRLDVIELYDWLNALNYSLALFLQKVGLINSNRFSQEDDVIYKTYDLYTGDIAVPEKGNIKAVAEGVIQILRWKNEKKEVVLKGITKDQYLLVEQQVSDIFSTLNLSGNTLKNREAIALALKIAIEALPGLNPSDVYHHIVYRLYIREYTKSNADQSWKRASGDAIETFIVNRYSSILLSHGISIKALNSDTQACKSALREMGISDKVSDSKLDIALYGEHNNKKILFGGVHCKASLAERVADDVPCSVHMMNAGYFSFLYTFDVKSFPKGDLVNYGELGRNKGTSDKRKSIEEHGNFSACFSYNTRGYSSPTSTTSGKKIHVSSLIPGEDMFPRSVIEAWNSFRIQLES